MIFLDPFAREFYADWDQVARIAVGNLPASAARFPDDERIERITGALTPRSEAFTAHRMHYDVCPRTREVKEFRHPEVGSLQLCFESMAVESTPGQHLSDLAGNIKSKWVSARCGRRGAAPQCNRATRTGHTVLHARPAGADPLQRPGALRSLHVPALVAVGMPDFFGGGETLVRELGSGPLVVVPGAAHLVPLDQPAAFRRLVLDFLATLDGPR